MGGYGIIRSSITVHFKPANKEKREKAQLFATFSRGEVHFRGPMLKLLGKRQLTAELAEVIKAKAPTSSVDIRSKLVSGAVAYSIHPNHLGPWAEEVKEELLKKGSQR